MQINPVARRKGHSLLMGNIHAREKRQMLRQRARYIGQAVLPLALILTIALAGAWPRAQQSTAPPRTEKDADFWQPLWMQRELWGPGKMPPGMRARLLRHTTYLQYGVQEQYQGAQSTVGATPPVIAAGGRLYEEHCAACHGKQGLGDGDASNSLLPSPALLAFMVQRPIAVDEYLLWSISEGGKDFGTAMPAFKDALSREDIWRIVAYMRAGFPEPRR